MSNGPVTGNGIAISIPLDKSVFWSAVAQAAYNQYVKVTTAAGAVVFEQSGASPDGHSPYQYGNGLFSTSAYNTTDYLVYIGINGGASWQSVQWDQAAITSGSDTYFTSIMFVSEDASDNDYNDTCLTLNWFEYLG